MQTTPKRLAALDNAKFLLIGLVILGHLIERIKYGNPAIKGTFLFIYSFHMPAFVFISGFLSKKDSDLKKDAFRLLVPLLIFHMIYCALESFLFLKPLPLSFVLTTPFFPLWFLLSLLCWKIALKLFGSSIYLLCASVIAALLAGYFPIGMEFSLSRTITFFPFFLLGHVAKTRNFSFESIKRFRIISLVFLFISSLFFVCIAKNIDPHIFYGAYSYKFLGQSLLTGPAIRASTIAISLILSFSFFSIVPCRETAFSELGKRSLYAYILHIPIDRFLNYFGFYNHSQSLAFLLALIAFFPIAWALSSKGVANLFSPLIDPLNTQALNAPIHIKRR
jgi:fucose 4-O-acetylase-like acetyltransferase